MTSSIEPFRSLSSQADLVRLRLLGKSVMCVAMCVLLPLYGVHLAPTPVPATPHALPQIDARSRWCGCSLHSDSRGVLWRLPSSPLFPALTSAELACLQQAAARGAPLVGALACVVIVAPSSRTRGRAILLRTQNER